MLSEVGFLLSVYFGLRLFEAHDKKAQKKNKNDGIQSLTKYHGVKRKKISIKNQDIKIHESVKDSQEITLIKKNEEANHYLKLSGVHLSLAIIRQFIYPPIAPLYLGVFIYSNFPLYRRAETSLMKYRRIDYYVSNAFTSIIALAFGQYVAMGIGNFFYFLGDKIIVITQRHSQKILTNTLEQLPSMVWCLRDNVEIEISLDNVHINDIIVVTIGEIIPIDGTIINGNAMIDQHALTGEQQPAEKSIGERVLASTLVISGKIWIKTEKTWKETTVFKIDQILNDSSQFKTQIQLQGETWADKIILPFQGMFLLTTAIYGPLVGLVVLSAHFGNRIRILAPLETFTHLKLASQKSILVKDGCALESLMKVDTILFDKTGTLTNKEFKVGKIILCNNYREDELLTYAAAAECKMTHPIAKAILSKAKASKLTLPDIDDSRYQVGYGITVIIENQVIKVGSIRFMKMEGIVPPDKIKKAMAYAHTKGHSLVMVAVNSCLIGAIELQPIVRSEVKQLINNLRRHGIKHIAIVSGDHKHPTKKLAEELGMDNYFYDILPQDKARIVEQLQKEGKSVCFVGDGINDTIAMKKADVSISLTGASSIATDVAEVVLMDGTLHHLIDLFEISKKLESNLRTSFGLTLVPTVINLSGAFFFNLGFTTAIIIKNIVFFVGLGHALLPMIKLEGTKNKGVRLVKKGSGSN